METGEEMTLKREMSKETTLRKEMRGGEEEDALPVLSISPKEINLQVGKNKTVQVSLRQTAGGAFSVVSVMGSRAVSVGGDVLGWLYTLAWDFSFLPQLLHNWRRKSFDFLTFNFFGFFSYFIFNMGLYWLHDIQSILHVRLNDVVFPLYALVCVCLQIAQCLAYKRAEGQRVSTACRVVTGLLVTGAVVGCVLVPLVQAWWWLDLLYLLSYVKLIITCIKYVPQLSPAPPAPPAAVKNITGLHRCTPSPENPCPAPLKP
ncbi:Cystinosin [Chionoecetes opilio]|uniref:Cystinosin n=1 Tax=Chionoecetes opilio TaxID=41210 RepID=A0A8J4Y8L0_CHIOP|nr:Cystinosin [Chionoecetes opilio]